MVGVVVVSHGDFARGLVETAEQIVGALDKVSWVSIKDRCNVDDIRKAIDKAIKKVNTGYGVLLLTDMFGGTPSNLSLTFLEKGKVEVLTGVNLPILLKLASIREGKSLEEIASILKEHGRKSISLASEVLEGKKQ